MTWWQQRGLRFKISLGVSMVLIVVLGVVLYGVVRYIREQLWQREVQAALEMNDAVIANAESAHIAQGWTLAMEAVSRVGEKAEGQIETIAIYALRDEQVGDLVYKDRKVMIGFASGFPGARDIDRSNLQKSTYSAGCMECHQHAPEDRDEVALVTVEGEQVMRSMLPMRNEESCQACHRGAREKERDLLGVTLVDFRPDRFRKTLNLIVAGVGIGVGAAFVLIILALFILLNRSILVPVGDLLAVTRSVTEGRWDRRVQVRSGDEIGQLGVAFNEMTEQLATTYGDLEQSLQEQREQARVLERALEDIQAGQEEQARLQETIVQMSTPVVPVQEDVLVMPLVGMIDPDRARQIRSALLTQVEEEGGLVVIFDVTGVPVIDAGVAQALLGMAEAVQLLGAEPVLVGIAPQVAETIVSLGVDLSGLTTRSDLQSGVSYAIRRLRGGHS